MTLGLRGRHSGYQSVANQNLIYLVQEIMIENDDDTDRDYCRRVLFRRSGWPN